MGNARQNKKEKPGKNHIYKMGNARKNKKTNLAKTRFIRWAMPDKKEKNKAKNRFIRWATRGKNRQMVSSSLPIH